jgi:hypothetical protein
MAVIRILLYFCYVHSLGLSYRYLTCVAGDSRHGFLPIGWNVPFPYRDILYFSATNIILQQVGSRSRLMSTVVYPYHFIGSGSKTSIMAFKSKFLELHTFTISVGRKIWAFGLQTVESWSWSITKWSRSAIRSIRAVWEPGSRKKLRQIHYLMIMFWGNTVSKLGSVS